MLCGSSYRNVGVQPLMDAIVNYLPSPADRNYEFVQAYAANRDLFSLAFKIQNDVQRGPLTFVRIYSGQIESVCKAFLPLKMSSKLKNLGLSRDKRYTMLLVEKRKNRLVFMWPVLMNWTKFSLCRKETSLFFLDLKCVLFFVFDFEVSPSPSLFRKQ